MVREAIIEESDSALSEQPVSPPWEAAPLPHKRLRVLFVSSTKHSGGIERYAVLLATRLQAVSFPGFDPSFACRPD